MKTAAKIVLVVLFLGIAASLAVPAGAATLSSPVEGSYGTQLTINGPGFGDKKGKVVLSNASDSVNLKIAKDGWTNAQITATLGKALPPGVYDVTVYPNTVPQIPLPGAFTINMPELDPLLESSGSEGEEITVTGWIFGTQKGKVSIEGVSKGKPKTINCKVTYWSKKVARERDAGRCCQCDDQRPRQRHFGENPALGSGAGERQRTFRSCKGEKGADIGEGNSALHSSRFRFNDETRRGKPRPVEAGIALGAGVHFQSQTDRGPGKCGEVKAQRFRGDIVVMDFKRLDLAAVYCQGSERDPVRLSRCAFAQVHAGLESKLPGPWQAQRKFDESDWTPTHLLAVFPRRMQRQTLTRRMHRYVRRCAGSDPFVICGDFNSPPGSPVFRYLTQRAGLSSAQVDVGHIDGADPRAFPTAGFMRLHMHLDHMFSGGGVRWVDLEGTSRFGDRRSPFAGLSDHVPLIGRLRCS